MFTKSESSIAMLSILKLIHKSALGIDIRKNELRLVALRMKSGGQNQIHTMRLPLHHGCVANDRVLDWPNFLSTLQSGLSHLNQRTKSIGLAFASGLVQVDSLWLPPQLNDHEIRAAILEKLETRAASPTDRALDYRKVANREDGFNQIVYASTEASYVRQCLAAFQSIKLDLTNVDVDIFAIKRAIDFYFDGFKAEDDVNAFLYPSEQDYLFAVFRQHTLLMQQRWRVDANVSEFVTTKVKRYQQAFPTDKIKNLLLFIPEIIEPLDCVEAVYDLFHLETLKNCDLSLDFLLATGIALHEIPHA